MRYRERNLQTYNWRSLSFVPNHNGDPPSVGVEEGGCWRGSEGAVWLEGLGVRDIEGVGNMSLPKP